MDAIDAQGWTGLHHACVAGGIRTVKVLIALQVCDVSHLSMYMNVNVVVLG